MFLSRFINELLSLSLSLVLLSFGASDHGPRRFAANTFSLVPLDLFYLFFILKWPGSVGIAKNAPVTRAASAVGANRRHRNKPTFCVAVAVSPAAVVVAATAVEVLIGSKAAIQRFPCAPSPTNSNLQQLPIRHYYLATYNQTLRRGCCCHCRRCGPWALQYAGGCTYLSLTTRLTVASQQRQLNECDCFVDNVERSSKIIY